MDIRRARPGDIPQLLALIRRYWDFEGIEGFAALRIELVLKELLEGPVARGSIWVAESHGTLVGYLIVVLVMSVEHQGLMGEIDEFFVLPEARAHGTGTRLLLAIGNRRARAFYERLGFGPRPGYELLDKPLG